MKKQICIMRHARSEPFGIVADDFDRTLIPRGVNEAKRTGKLIAKEHFKPELLLASDAPRALYSLRFAAEEMGCSPEEVTTDKCIYPAGAGELLEIIRALPDSINSVMLCGHNPAVSGLLSLLWPDGGCSMRTAEAVALELDTQSWLLAGKTASVRLFSVTTNERQ